MKTRLILCLLMVQLFVLSGPHRVLPCEREYPASPEGVVSAFVEESFKGGRGFVERIERYLMSSEAPGWDITVLVSDYRVSGGKVSGDRAMVPVTYNVIGQLWFDESGPVFSANSSGSKSVEFSLVLDGECWKILGSDEYPHFDARAVARTYRKHDSYRYNRIAAAIEAILVKGVPK